MIGVGVITTAAMDRSCVRRWRNARRAGKDL